MTEHVQVTGFSRKCLQNSAYRRSTRAAHFTKEMIIRATHERLIVNWGGYSKTHKRLVWISKHWTVKRTAGCINLNTDRDNNFVPQIRVYSGKKWGLIDDCYSKCYSYLKQFDNDLIFKQFVGVRGVGNQALDFVRCDLRELLLFVYFSLQLINFSSISVGIVEMEGWPFWLTIWVLTSFFVEP